MPVTLVGREGHFHGKSLYYIVRNLRNLGVGRFVYRHKFAERFSEPCFYKLTDVKPELNAKGYFRGVAYGESVWKGELCRSTKIESGHKPDWRLVPREHESEYKEYLENARARQAVEKVPTVVLPMYEKLPPLMELILKDELLAENLPATKEVLRCKKKIKKNHKVIFDESIDD